jgi:hypothetical protein
MSSPGKEWGRSEVVVIAETVRHRPIGRDQAADSGKGARGVAVVVRRWVGRDHDFR